MLDTEERTKQAFELFKHISTLGTGLLAFTFGVEKFLPHHHTGTTTLLCIFAMSVFCGVSTMIGIVFKPTIESPFSEYNREEKIMRWAITWFFRCVACFSLFTFLFGIWVAVIVLDASK
jgi:hypothetical protein